MITAHFFSQLTDSPKGFQGNIFKVPFYLTLIFYFLISALTATGILFLASSFPSPTELTVLSYLVFFGPFLLFILYKSKKYFPLIIALSIIQVITLTSLSSNFLSFFNRYPMKKFANVISTDPQLDKRIGLYRLGNHRARMGVMTGLPSIYLNNAEELKLFIEDKNNVYIVMRQSDWESDLSKLPMNITATDTGWKKLQLSKAKIELLLKSGLIPQLQEYSESYVLLKTGNHKLSIE